MILRWVRHQHYIFHIVTISILDLLGPNEDTRFTIHLPYTKLHPSSSSQMTDLMYAFVDHCHVQICESCNIRDIILIICCGQRGYTNSIKLNSKHDKENKSTHCSVTGQYSHEKKQQAMHSITTISICNHSRRLSLLQDIWRSLKITARMQDGQTRQKSDFFRQQCDAPCLEEKSVYDPKNTIPTVKFRGGSIIVWGLFLFKQYQQNLNYLRDEWSHSPG